MLWSIVAYFVSKFYSLLLKNGTEQQKQERAQEKDTVAAIGALLVRTVGETGSNTSSNANQLFFRIISQLLCLTPNSCSPETRLPLV